MTHMDSQTEPIMDVGYKHRSTQTRMIFTFSETSRGRRDAMDSVGLILPYQQAENLVKIGTPPKKPCKTTTSMPDRTKVTQTVLGRP